MVPDPSSGQLTLSLCWEVAVRGREGTQACPDQSLRCHRGGSIGMGGRKRRRGSLWGGVCRQWSPELNLAPHVPEPGWDGSGSPIPAPVSHCPPVPTGPPLGALPLGEAVRVSQASQQGEPHPISPRLPGSDQPGSDQPEGQGDQLPLSF